MDIIKTDEWKLYEKGKEFLNKKNVYDDTDKSQRFYNGNQWKGVRAGVIQPITYNVIKPIVKYKIGVVNANGYSICFEPNNFDDIRFQVEMTEICRAINEYINILWEQKKIDAKARNILKDGCISGEGVMYLYYDEVNGEVEAEVLNNTDIYYENENDEDIQSQGYILVKHRESVSAVRKEAEALRELGRNSLREEDIKNIKGDNETKEQAGEYAKEELNDMVTVLSKLYKKDGVVWIKRSLKELVIEEERSIGISLYPLSHFVWESVKGSARGKGEVIDLIPNQIEINKTATRRALSVMNSAYPKLVANRKKISNVDSLTKVGTAILTEDNTVDDVRNVVGYLNPATMSPDSQILQNELITNTRELAGAGDVLTGNVNPERASGQAILAVQQSGEQTLTEQVIRFKDFLEDIARIIFEMWQVYTGEDGKKIVVRESLSNIEDEMNDIPYQENVNPYSQDEVVFADDFDERLVESKVGYGQEIDYIEKNRKDLDNREVFITKTIRQDIIKKLKVSIKIEVSPNSPFDKYAREASLENLMVHDKITFEEYAENIPEDASMPKHILTNILRRRRQEQAKINQIEQKASQVKAELDASIDNAQLTNDLVNAPIPAPAEKQERQATNGNVGGEEEFYN